MSIFSLLTLVVRQVSFNYCHSERSIAERRISPSVIKTLHFAKSDKHHNHIGQSTSKHPLKIDIPIFLCFFENTTYEGLKSFRRYERFWDILSIPS